MFKICSPKKSAFTLAELLITLAIIGIVATMTIPALISKYQEKETVSRVKKYYSVMNQALLLAVAEKGDMSSWKFENATDFANYIKPYLKVVKDCGIESGCLVGAEYKYLNGLGNKNYDIDNSYYKMSLNDGMCIWFQTDNVSDVKVQFFFDTNGNKGPNIWGKDLFNFLLYEKQNKFVPENVNDCYLDSRGYSCASFILRNDNMNYPAVKPSED